MKEYIGNSAFPDKIRQNMESLTEADEMAEFMFLGLRMTEGVSMEAFAEYFGKNMENVYGEVLKNIWRSECWNKKETGYIFRERESM